MKIVPVDVLALTTLVGAPISTVRSRSGIQPRRLPQGLQQVVAGPHLPGVPTRCQPDEKDHGVMYRLGMRAAAAACLTRGFLLSTWIRLWGGQVGRRLCVGRSVRLPQLPHPGWEIGDSVSLGHGVVLDVAPGGRMVLGDNSKILHYTVVGVIDSLTIDKMAQVAELCSVRDHDHRTDLGLNLNTGPLVSAPVFIGEGAWVARGSAVLRGSRIGIGAIVGANSLVRGIVPAQTIVAGSPARVLRRRKLD